MADISKKSSKRADNGDAPKLSPALQAQVLGTLQGRIKPVPTSGSYRAGMVLALAVLLLLVGVYLALVGAVVGGSLWHALHNTGVVTSQAGGGKRAVGAIVLYVLGLVVGPIVALFLIKPLFARQALHGRPRNLKREAEPLLFEYVDEVCDTVGAPRPYAIRLEVDANAAASFEGGLLGVFGRGRLVLIIGLPLVAGLSLRQFTGVLAHEFGHFSQGAAMRMGYLIRTLLMWFARVVYERDAWDYRLERFGDGGDIRFKLLIWSVQLTIWLSRRVLWCLMQIGHAVSCLVSRQQEFDADLHESRLVGWPVVGATLRRVTELSVAHSMAMDDLHKFWQEEQLPDDLPRLIASNVRQITPAMQERLKKFRKAAKTGWFDTHPSDRDRVRSVKAEGSTGQYVLNGLSEETPASMLFGNFARLCKAVSIQYYKEVLGERFDEKTVQSVEKLIELRNAEAAAAKSLARYFQVRVPLFAPLPLGDSAGEPPESPKETAAALKELRTRMLVILDRYKMLCRRMERAETALFESAGALSLLEAGCRFKPAQFGLRRATDEAATDRQENAQLAIETLATKMLIFETVAGDRLSFALQLLRVPKVQERIENGLQLAAEITRLLPLARLVSRQVIDLPAFRTAYHRFFLLMGGLSQLLSKGEQPSKTHIDGIIGCVEEICHRLKVMKKSLTKHPYPFEHARDDITLDEFLVPFIPDADDQESWGSVFDATTELFERLVGLQLRLFARLAFAAEKVETALGLPELPEPNLDDSDDEVAEDDEE